VLSVIGGPKILLGIGALAAASLVSVGVYTLVERVTGGGSGATGAPGAAGSTPSSAASSKPNGNANGNNGNVPESKSFLIGIDHQADDLGPGATTNVYMTVTNTTNQNIVVDGLSATVTAVTRDAQNHFSGTCTLANAGATVGTWTGQPFPVTQSPTPSSSPGYIPLSLATSAPDACQGAAFTLSFSGTAAKA
jgi:hypothetical protein